MRIKLIGLLLIIVSNTYGQTTLEARINNLRQGNVYLWNTATNQIDSLEIKNYSFTYKTELTEPTLFYVKFEGYNDWDYPIRIVLSSNPTSMTLRELKQVKHGTWKSIYPNRPTFQTDPNLNTKLFEFETVWKIFSDSIIKLSPESGDCEIFLEKRKDLYNEFIQSSDKLVKNYPDKIISAVAVFEFLIRSRMIDVDKTIQLFQQFGDRVKYSTAGMKIGEHINKELSIEIGKVAPNFEFQDIKGAKYNLSQFKNKTILLHFWSSTCGPCRVENKRIKEINKTNREIAIINVSLDTNETQWKKAIEKDGLTDMLNTSDVKGTNQKIVQDYYVHGIPTHYLIDKEGVIISKGSLDEIKSRITTP
jgi:thiol-disulfide isomerase/thioredoxin